MRNIQIYLILTGVMMAWGINVPILKILVETVSPITVTSIRIFTAGICVLLILLFLKMLRKPSSREVSYIIIGGLLNVVCHHYFLSIGLTKTTGTNGGLILGLGPLLTALMAVLFLGRKPTIIRIIGFVLGSIGILVTVLTGSNGVAGVTIGDLYVFLAIFTQALSFIVISKAAKTMDPRLLTGYMLLVGAAVLFAISLWQEPNSIGEFFTMSWVLWVAFFASAILATALGHMLYNYAIGKTGPAEASIFMNLNTFFALVGSALILGEEITKSHLLGLVFIVSGVICGSGALEDILNKRKSIRKNAIKKAG